ncbi:MAG: PEGA domain-containing protein [Myxococcus sp.]|nr:PEGA domain-containing protein [Myxococcus sp.]
MNDLNQNEGAGEVPPEVRAFYALHRDTGEPEAAQLRQARFEQGPTLERRWLPPEVMAVAAVLVVSLGAAAVGWYVKSRSVVANDAMPEAAAPPSASAQQPGGGEVEADEKFAQEQGTLLVQQGLPHQVVSRALSLFVVSLHVSARSPSLALQNFREVASLVPGTALAGRADALAQALVEAEASRPPPAPAPPPDHAAAAELLEHGRRYLREKRFSDAIRVLHRCLAVSNDDLDCMLQLGSSYAARSATEGSVSDQETARGLYERFLVIAPADDARRARVRALLPGGASAEGEATGEAEEAPPDPRALLQRARQLSALVPGEARALFEEVIRVAPTSPEAAEARSGLAALEATSTRSGLLRIASTPMGARVFVDGVDTGRTTPVPSGQPLEVTSGQHTISCDLGDGQRASTRVDVSPGENPVVRLDLR